MIMNVYDIIGYIATFLTIITGIPQLIKIIKNKKSNDVSLSMFVILAIAQILWVVYGIYRSDVQIIITNVIAGFITLFIIYITIYYNNVYTNGNTMPIID
jgi:MtN3 and saliva related transmembrane protein